MRPGDIRSSVAPALGALAALLLLASACGGSDSPADGGLFPAADGTTTPTAAAEETGAAEGIDRRDELLGRWNLDHYLLSDGRGMTNVLGEDVHITFNDDGSVDYNTGCNNGGTTYSTSGTYYVPESALDDQPEGQPITLGPTFEQEERGCEGFLGEQDLDLPLQLGTATRFVLDGDSLTLLDDRFLVSGVRAG